MILKSNGNSRRGVNSTREGMYIRDRPLLIQMLKGLFDQLESSLNYTIASTSHCHCIPLLYMDLFDIMTAIYVNDMK